MVKATKEGVNKKKETEVSGKRLSRKRKGRRNEGSGK